MDIVDLNVNTPKAWANLCFVELSSRDKFSLEKKPEIDTELSKKNEVFVDFDAISIQFLRDFVLSFNTINSATEQRAMHCIFEKNVAAFCFKNSSERLQSSGKILTSSFSCNLCAF